MNPGLIFFVLGLRRSRSSRFRGNDPARSRLQPGREDQQERTDDDPSGHCQAQPGGGDDRIDITTIRS